MHKQVETTIKSRTVLTFLFIFLDRTMAAVISSTSSSSPSLSEEEEVVEPSLCTSTSTAYSSLYSSDLISSVGKVYITLFGFLKHN